MLLDLYHRTSLEAYERIVQERQMVSRENTREVYFSNREFGQAEGYGDFVVHVRVPEELAQLEDEFPDGELHYRVRVQDLAAEHFIV